MHEARSPGSSQDKRASVDVDIPEEARVEGSHEHGCNRASSLDVTVLKLVQGAVSIVLV